MKHRKTFPNFSPVLTLLSHHSPEDIQRAKDSGIVYAVKLYPANVTTNSQHGVTSIDQIKPTLATMSALGMPLLVHGEVNDPSVDIFDREKIFIDSTLIPIRREFPDLKIVMEHITTSDAVEFVNSFPNTAATITIHHLLYNRNDIFAGNKIHPHLYCLPILKSEANRQALVAAALSASPKFFFGTDSAPHSVTTKECSDGCAGVFSSPVAVPLLVEFFENHSSLHLLEDFLCHNGANFYGLPLLNRKMKLRKEPWVVPSHYEFGEGIVKPLNAGKEILWQVCLE
jgi:dihydroorotase